ncbi:MAG: radical SAM protein [Chloroflexi bacterium]|nr:radical SAM protein [Chloroflexota bacterium]
MNQKQLAKARIDEDGRMIFPPEIASRFGIKPGTEIHLDEGSNEIRLLRPTTHLAKIYVEPTNLCNLDCVTCMRNVWGESAGTMSDETFERIFEGLQSMFPLPTVFFGGYGEPLIHPKIVTWVQRIKALGARVELITNGILLTEERSLQFIRAGLDVLWVSLDGSSPESYADVRLGSSLPKVIDNLKTLSTIRYKATDIDNSKPNLGIAFVAMKSNIADLPEVLRMGISLGAKQFSISNVLAHTPELHEQVLYKRTIFNNAARLNTSFPHINLARMDWNDLTKDVLAEIYGRKYQLEVAGYEVNRAVDSCPFIEQGSTAIRWDGSVCPCLPLLHTNQNYFEKRLRHSKAYAVGNVLERNLLDIWNDKEYSNLRERVQRFDFSPCTFCNGCGLSDNNQEDCLGNTELACGGCLWAQGVIRCP